MGSPAKHDMVDVKVNLVVMVVDSDGCCQVRLDFVGHLSGILLGPQIPQSSCRGGILGDDMGCTLITYDTKCLKAEHLEYGTLALASNIQVIAHHEM